jgi:site-specific recombinase XerD
MAGVSLADIADLMGHKDLATTQVYAKVEQALEALLAAHGD